MMRTAGLTAHLSSKQKLRSFLRAKGLAPGMLRQSLETPVGLAGSVTELLPSAFDPAGSDTRIWTFALRNARSHKRLCSFRRLDRLLWLRLVRPSEGGDVPERFKELSYTVSVTISTQFFLALTSSFAFFVILTFLPIQTEMRLVCAVVLLQVLASAISPQWVYLGLERIRTFALLQFIFRVAAACGIVALVRTPADVLLYVGINAAFASLIALSSFYALKAHGIRWVKPAAADIISTLKGAFRLFLSTLAINLYTTSNILVVTCVLGAAGAGPFALADRLRQGTSGALGPITSAIYPFVCRTMHREPTLEEHATKQLFFRLIVVAAAILSAALFWFASPIVAIAGGGAFHSTVQVLQFMAFLPFVIAISNIIGVQTMIPMYMDRQVSWVVSVAAVVGTVILAGLLLGLDCGALGLLCSGLNVL